MVESTIMSCCTITCSTTARFMAKWVFDGEAQGSFVTRKYVGVFFLSGWRGGGGGGGSMMRR